MHKQYVMFEERVKSYDGVMILTGRKIEFCFSDWLYVNCPNGKTMYLKGY